MNFAAPIEPSERIDAAAQLIVAGRHTEAESILRGILLQHPNHPDAVNTLASIALAQRDGKRAFDVLAPACTAFPDHARLLANLGLAHMLLARPQEAVVCLERAVALAPFDVDIRLSYSQFLATAGDLPRALEEIETILRQDPQNVAALSRLGLVAMATRDLARAETAWRQAASLDPHNADVLSNLSTLCSSTGRHLEALRLAERAHIWAPSISAKDSSSRAAVPVSAISKVPAPSASKC